MGLLASPPPDARWSEWGAWSPCSKSCGSGGKRIRRRSCKKSKRSRCVGRPSEVQKCARTPCPGTGHGATHSKGDQSPEGPGFGGQVILHLHFGVSGREPLFFRTVQKPSGFGNWTQLVGA